MFFFKRSNTINRFWYNAGMSETKTGHKVIDRTGQEARGINSPERRHFFPGITRNPSEIALANKETGEIKPRSVRLTKYNPKFYPHQGPFYDFEEGQIELMFWGTKEDFERQPFYSGKVVGSLGNVETAREWAETHRDEWWFAAKGDVVLVEKSVIQA